MTHSILLIVSGSIAAYKSLDLIRRLQERDVKVRCILTKGGAEFITPLSVASLCGDEVYSELFSLKDEVEMGHIRLSREADLVVVAPASADLIAKMANGYANDLASATLLANNKKLLVAPAMNMQMWKHPATQRNVAQIEADGAQVIPPGSGMLACGEEGQGRMAEVEDIAAAIMATLPSESSARLKGKHALVTAGATREAIDPVRFITNRSSGKQGYAIAAELARQGAKVTLVNGISNLDTPEGVTKIDVITAEEMLAACEKALPADIAICTAAVADWKVENASAQKLKKQKGKKVSLELAENPDILAQLCAHKKRPQLVIGFAAETDNILQNAKEKMARKGCDWIVANDVSGGKGFDKNENQISLITKDGEENWPLQSKKQVAEKLVEKIIFALCNPEERMKILS